MFKDLKVIFMGTPDFGEEAFKYLIENTNVIMAVVQPDKVVGRKKILTAPFIKKMALDNNVDVFQPINIRKDYSKIVELQPDLIITAAYGQIVPKEVLEAAKLGCINLHGSILPKYRGASPIQYALLNGDKETGVSLMYMDQKMDTGDIIDILKIDIEKTDNYPLLYKKLGIVAKEVLEKNLEDIINKTNKRIKQDENFATYCPMIKREDELLNFNLQGNQVINKVRGIYPNAYFLVNNEVMKVLEAEFISKKINKDFEITKNEFLISVKDGAINLKIVKPFGKKVMDIKSYLNGIDKSKISLIEREN